MRLMNGGHIHDRARGEVFDLIDRARDHDGVPPVSEQGRLHLRHGTTAGIRHLVLEADETIVGYAQLDARPGGEPAAELVVDPVARRRGCGGGLLDGLLEEDPAIRVWSHGLLPGAAELAASRGLRPVRELLKLHRPLAPGDAFPTDLPPGYALATYTPRDAQDWLTVNAAAFADHAEQGRMTLADLLDREGEDWFDPAGFFLVRDQEGRLAASHWTKVDGDVGEVYVVGVSPDHQGLGLGRAVTAIGLAHLRDAGLSGVELYVDGDNEAAIATYRAQGFRTATRDVQFAAGVSR